MKFKGQVDIEELSKLLIQKQSKAGQDHFVRDSANYESALSGL